MNLSLSSHRRWRGQAALWPMARYCTNLPVFRILLTFLPMKTPVSNWLASRSCMTLRCWIRLPLKVNSTPALPIFIPPGRLRVFYDPRAFPCASRAGEVYFGLRGTGLLLLQTEQGDARLEKVFAGSVHIIPGFTAHRLINTGEEVLSALAVWPGIAGHDYAALTVGFRIRVFEENKRVQAKEVQNG